MISKTSFGKFLEKHKVGYRDAAQALGVTSSYVSMLARGPTTPGLKLAVRISEWSTKKLGEDFAPGEWV